MAEQFSTKTRGLIDERDAGACVSCGGRGSEKHHRRRRRENGDGKAHTPANGALFCGWGNHTGCHGALHSNPTMGRRRGWIIRPGRDPAAVPMWHYSRGWIWLSEDGAWRPVRSTDVLALLEAEGATAIAADSAWHDD